MVGFDVPGEVKDRETGRQGDRETGGQGDREKKRMRLNDNRYIIEGNE